MEGVSLPMQQYAITQIGEFHTNNNEDFLIAKDIGTGTIMLAVMDGCSMGDESYFASTLIGKILRKIAKEIYYKAFIEQQEYSLDAMLKTITQQLFDQLRTVKHQLHLRTNELLSTLILGIIDTPKRTAEIIAIGDGLVIHNEQWVEYEQDDKPDYLGFHLEEAFEKWYSQQEQRLSLSQIQDLSISTDGIFTFKKFDNKTYESIEETQIIDFLLKDRQGEETPYMLKQKLIAIEKQWGLKPTDDLSILRVILK